MTKFEENITLNVGGMLKDLQDIKLQMAASGLSKQGSQTAFTAIENEIAQIK